MRRFTLVIALLWLAPALTAAAARPPAGPAPAQAGSSSPWRIVPEAAPSLRSLVVEPARPVSGRVPGARPA